MPDKRHMCIVQFIKRIDVDTRLLRTFAVVAEELHFGRAAGRLYTTQPSVSRAIRELERAVGTSLLERTSRQVTLSEAGRHLLADLPALLAGIEGALHRARRVGHGEEGELHVGFVASAANQVLPAVIPRFRARLPLAHLRLSEGFDRDMADALLAGNSAVAFVRSTDERAGLSHEALYVEASCLAVARDHHLARRPSVSYADLRGEPLIIWPRLHAPPPAHDVVAGCRAAGFEPEVVQEATSPATILGLVAAGVGVAVLAQSYAVLRAADLVFVPFPGRDTTVYLSWSPSKTWNLRQEFIDTARETVASGAAAVVAA